MKKRALFLFSLTLLLASEPSVFEAGNLEKENPYGLTKEEMYIYQNKKDISSLRKSLFDIKERLDRLEESNEGLKSIVEGIDERLNLLSKNSKTKEEITALKEELNKTISTQKEQFEKFKEVLSKMGSLVDEINGNYVSKDEFNKELRKIYSLIEGKKVTKKSGYELFKEAKRAYAKKDYSRAKELFLLSIKKGYKPATSSFYLGESCYYSKDYECAVSYYKKSATLYQKSKFMPVLLLHTAISLDRLGKKEEAKKFYLAVISSYPDTKAAKIAKRYLAKIKN